MIAKEDIPFTMTVDLGQLESLADSLALKVKHCLITQMGRSIEEANSDEVYKALSYALREEVMINWTTTAKTISSQRKRTLYYLSMEYMPGRMLLNNVVNISAREVVMIAMQKLGRPFGEIASREFDPSLGNGGLGRLASCLLDSLATLHYPAIGYGLRYQYGIFEQQIWDGRQIEAPDLWLMSEHPWEFRQDLRRVSVKFCGVSKSTKNIHGDEIYGLENYEEVFALPYDFPIVGYSKTQDFSVVTLRLWSTKESPRNFQLQKYNAGKLDQAAENTLLTDVLYPSDWHDAGKRIRLKQEFLLVSASMQDILRRYLSLHDNFRAFADNVRIQINDTHPTLAIAELMHSLTKIYDIPWKMAWEMTQAVTSYTNHTVLAEALEQWDRPLMEYLLPRQTRIIERINQDFCDKVRSKLPGDEDAIHRVSIVENEKVRMANLAIVGSHAVNGVAAIHTEILKHVVFKDFYNLWPEKFINVTIGVTQRRWLLLCNRELANWITKKIGDSWITHFEDIAKLRQFAGDHDSKMELQEIKRKNKVKLIEFIRHFVKSKDAEGRVVGPPPIVDVNSIFDVQIKRFHEYKRQLMNALHALMIYFEIKDNKDATTRFPRTVLFSGKAAASYETAKNVIQMIYLLARKINRDPDVNRFLKIVFIENYNVSKAEIIIPAADLSEQISTAGMEASGTGNMKLAMNGALTIGTDDGANVEMRESVGDTHWPFLFGLRSHEVAALKASGQYQPQEELIKNPLMRRAVEALRDGTLAETDQEKQAMASLYRILVEGGQDGPGDYFLVLKDLPAFYETQKKVEALYADPDAWFEAVIYNIAGMGPFSTDVAIHNYATKIWGIEPCPLDPAILEHIRAEYRENDRCRIY